MYEPIPEFAAALNALLARVSELEADAVQLAFELKDAKTAQLLAEGQRDAAEAKVTALEQQVTDLQAQLDALKPKPTRKVLFGCYLHENENGGGTTAQAFAYREQNAWGGHKIELARMYLSMDVQGGAIVNAQALLDAGRIPILSVSDVYQGPVDWQRTANGEFDSKLRTMATQWQKLDTHGLPVYLSYHQEGEARFRHLESGLTAAGNTTTAYKAAWNRAYSIWRPMLPAQFHIGCVYQGQAGSPNQGWPATQGGNDDLWPKDASGKVALEWLGWDPYNWFNVPNHMGPWNSPEQVILPGYNAAKGLAIPMILTETGCAEDPAQPTRKAQWLKDLVALLASDRMPLVLGHTYFDVIKEADWRVDSSPASKLAWGEALTAAGH